LVNYKALGQELEELLSLKVSPMAITFSKNPVEGIDRFKGEIPPPNEDGRTGKVAAGCVFWMHGTERSFTTTPEDHGNCSVGSLTHGMKTLEEIKENSDIAAILECGWVEMETVPEIPVVKEKPNYVTYEPLTETIMKPDVVFLRINGKQAMFLKDAFPELRFEGKPQCHIVPMAKEGNEIAVSVGCMLSRVRTGMSSNEMTAAIPARRLPEVVDRIRSACSIDNTVASYAAEDSARFRN
jgi:uncharacterized protein (DUF169 family)